MRLASAGHSQGTDIIRQAIVCFVLNAVSRLFLRHIGNHAATLNHKAINNTVKDSACVVTVHCVLQKVGGR